MSSAANDVRQSEQHTPEGVVAHLTPENWSLANRHLVRKALAEFAHELLITPQPDGDGRYRVLSDDGATEYVFAARVLELCHWQIDAASIVRRATESGAELPLDGVELVLDLRHSLSLTDAVLPVYLEEITSTLSSAAYKLAGPDVSAAELAVADFQTVEAGMTEGHPCFVANNGRLGFDSAEYRRYAPEVAASVQLIWVAARREHTVFAAGDGIGYEELVERELGGAVRAAFDARLERLGLDPLDYQLIPVHPWQWWNKLSVTYAGELARRDLVCLGHGGDDEYRPQQSIRTLYNTTEPRRHYVKTALSVLNMGFMRGLSADYMQATPAINDWLHQLIEDDPFLATTGFGILRERAAIGYRHPQYAAAVPKGSPYLKMLAALWRESPAPRLAKGERLMTMAALLHVDRHGDSLAAALVERSGKTAEEWLGGYLQAYLVPVLHSFYQYGLVYMPHGENVILVLGEDGVRRALFKDIAEEIAVLDPDTKLPPEVERIRADTAEELRILSIFTDVFDCFLRFLAATLDESGTLTRDRFWKAVARTIADYQSANPQLAERFQRYDLFTDRFALSCLNRLQLRDNTQMVDLQNPASALQLAGTLDNPIAAHRPTLAGRITGIR